MDEKNKGDFESLIVALQHAVNIQRVMEGGGGIKTRKTSFGEAMQRDIGKAKPN
jgi:hypothetical protein